MLGEVVGAQVSVPLSDLDRGMPEDLRQPFDAAPVDHVVAGEGVATGLVEGDLRQTQRVPRS